MKYWAEDGSAFDSGCNRCACHQGEIVCTKYQCGYSPRGTAVAWSCPLYAAPVCSAITGKRYLNACFPHVNFNNSAGGTSSTVALEPLFDCSGGAGDFGGDLRHRCYTVLKLVYSRRHVEWLRARIPDSSGAGLTLDIVGHALANLLSYRHCKVSFN